VVILRYVYVAPVSVAVVYKASAAAGSGGRELSGSAPCDEPSAASFVLVGIA